MSGVGYAAVASSQGTIGACVKRQGGMLYLASRCSQHDRRLVWSVSGVPGSPGKLGTQGIQGVQGIQGAPGAAGATKVVERETVKTTNTGSNDTATVLCNAGEVATGGGWQMESGNVANFLTFGDYPVQSNGSTAGPGDTPAGWYVSIYNNSGSTDTWRVYVICASP